MKLSITILLLLLSASVLSCGQSLQDEQILFGTDFFVKEKLYLLEDRKVGLVINQTSRLSDGTSLLDTFVKLGAKVVNITSLFSLEHGIKGEFADGVSINGQKYDSNNIPIYSLYGREKKPTQEMLKNVDLIIFNVQDIGARFYTYISSMFYVLQASAENNISVIILDRPNPIGGERVEGPALESGFESFIGIAQLPIIHGMTTGELALMFSGENYIKTETAPDLTVIKMKDWERNITWMELNKEWIPTSPNIPTFETAFVYPGTCLIEGTNVSEGRGTNYPFITIGAPFIITEELIKELNLTGLEGVEITPTSFTPVKIEGKSTNPKFENELCYGIKISLTNHKEFNSVYFGIKLIYVLHKLYHHKFKFREDYFDKLAGTDKIRLWIEEGKDPEFIISSWQDELIKFNKIRNKYLLY